MGTLIEHLESALGTIQSGWNKGPDGKELPFQVVRFSTGAAGRGVVACSTLGMSRHALKTPTGRVIRQELLLLGPEALVTSTLPSLLTQVGTNLVQEHRAVLRGDVLGPAGPLAPGLTMEALYVTSPVYFADEFAVFEGAQDPIVIAWLVPIAAVEARYVRTHGWKPFENLLVEYDPDLTDFHRSPLRPCTA